MMEAGVVVGTGGEALHWHLPPDRSGGALPDSRDLWDVIWENRDRLLGFAHSHPGSGFPSPSRTDVTTFIAIEKALGRRLFWWITSADEVIVIRREEPPGEAYGIIRISDSGLLWLPELRQHSNYLYKHS